VSENFYDNVIAPELARLAKLCEAQGMLSFLAQVEFARDETAETKWIAAGAGVKTHIAHMGIACHGNVDSLIWGIKRYAKKHGHQSAELHLAGIPATPSQSDAGAEHE
jgi:hypothetical protein